MTRDELFELLEIDTPADFEYFEQLAELLESEEDIPFDLFYIALSEISPETASELLENYFKELEDSIPDGADELESLAGTLKDQLLSYAEGIEDPDGRRDLARELYKFREWYHDADGAEVDGKPYSVMDALYEHRAEGFAGSSHEYSFPGALKYELEEFTLRLGSYEKVDVAGGEPAEDEE